MAKPTNHAPRAAFTTRVRRYLLPAIFALLTLAAILVTSGKIKIPPRSNTENAATSRSPHADTSASSASTESSRRVRSTRPGSIASSQERALLGEITQQQDPFSDERPEEAYQRLALLWVTADPEAAVRRAYAMPEHPGLLKHVARAIGTHHVARWQYLLPIIPDTASRERMIFLGGILDTTDTGQREHALLMVSTTMITEKDQDMIKLVAIEIMAKTDAEWLLTPLRESHAKIYEPFLSAASFPDPRSGLRLIEELPMEQRDNYLNRFPGNSRMTTRNRRELADFIEGSAYDSWQKDTIIVRSLCSGDPLEAGDHEIIARIQDAELRDKIATEVSKSRGNPVDPRVVHNLIGTSRESRLQDGE